MTTYEINRKYDAMRKSKVDQELIDIFFNTKELKGQFKESETVKSICILRSVNNNTYGEISKKTNLSISTIRYYYNRVIRLYNSYINKKRYAELDTAKLANVQKFNQNAGLHDVNVELLAEEISKLPMWIWGIEDQKERSKQLLEWFFKEAE